MLQDVMNMVRETVSNAISGNQEVPEEKKGQVVETTTHAIADGLKRNMNMDNLKGIVSLFKGHDSTDKNPITGNIETSVANALKEQVGLQPNTANSITASIVPMVISALAGRMNDPNDKEFDVQNLIRSFIGTTTSDEIYEKANLFSGIKSIFEK